MEDVSKRHPFWEVLQRPKTAPPRLNTFGMELFAPLTAEEKALYEKQKSEKKLAQQAALKRSRGDEGSPGGSGEGGSGDGEDGSGGCGGSGVDDTPEGLKNLASDTIELLETMELDGHMANRVRGLLAKLRRLKRGSLGAEDSALFDDEGEDMSGEGSEMGIDGEGADGVGGKKKGKKGYDLDMVTSIDPKRYVIWLVGVIT